MNKSHSSAHIRLEFLTELINQLQPGNTLHTSAMEEVNELKFWLDKQQESDESDGDAAEGTS